MSTPRMQHPALLMLKVWGGCGALYAVLPIQLVDRTLSLQGHLMLAMFLAAFCLGTVLPAPARPPRSAGLAVQLPGFRRVETLLAGASAIATMAMLLDLRGKSVFDLAEAYDLRSDQASALMEGAASASSVWFQVGFLTYPAAYVYLVRTIIFERRIKWLRLGAFGVLPVILATATMGGRGPILYAILLAGLAWRLRRRLLAEPARSERRPGLPRRWITLGAAVVVCVALYYFMAVFLARAEVVGGAEGMFRFAESVWGVSFQGPVAEVMFAALGTEATYLIFIFGWYIVQGLVMFNILASDYHGPLQLGVYGLDLVSALVRRVDGGIVARNFDALQQLGVYGFFPSAFGSLYVDLWAVGLLACVAWGAVAGMTHQKIRAGRDARWVLLAPFMTMGILFSFINTPLGFSNGLVTYLWLIAAFVTARPRRVARPATIGQPA